MISSEQATAYINNMQLMNQIVRELKEIPELPSEAPKDVSALIKVEFPEVGGVLTYMEGHEFPYRGFPFYEFVDKIDVIKKIVRSFLSGIYHLLKNKNRLWFLTLIPAAWFSRIAIRGFVYTFYRLIERFRMKKEKYSDAVREIHRAFSVQIEGETKPESEFREMLRDLICMILENDNAYRFRAQDISEELDKQNLNKSVEHEIVRLLSIMQEREIDQPIKDTWHLFKWFIVGYLKFDRPLKRILTSVLSNIDIGKTKLSREDKWYCPQRKDYVMGFVKNPKTGDDRYIIDLSYRAMKLREDVVVFRNQTNSEIAEIDKRQNPEEKQLYLKGREVLFKQLVEQYETGKQQLKQKYGSN